MLETLNNDFKKIFGETCEERFFASAVNVRYSEKGICEESTYGTYAAAKARKDGVISVSFGEEKHTTNLNDVSSIGELKFIADVIEAYKECGCEVTKGLDIIYNSCVPEVSGYSKDNSLKFATVQAFNRIEGFNIDTLKVLKMSIY